MLSGKCVSNKVIFKDTPQHTLKRTDVSTSESSSHGLQDKKAQIRHSKMAVSRHLGFYGTANSVIRSADPKNPNLEPNMEWIRCTVCEIVSFKQYCNLETGVWGHSR